MLFALIGSWFSVMFLGIAFGSREAVLGLVASVLVTVLSKLRG